MRCCLGRCDQMNLSKNFSYEEMTKSQTGSRLGLDNEPDDECLEALKLLCEKLLEPIRESLGPVHVNSGYRSGELNRAIGGTATSQHCRGQAADIEVPGFSNVELAKWIETKCDYDQLILECHKPGVPNSGWVHVSYRASGNRKQELTATVVNGRMTYTIGIKP